MLRVHPRTGLIVCPSDMNKESLQQIETMKRSNRDSRGDNVVEQPAKRRLQRHLPMCSRREGGKTDAWPASHQGGRGQRLGEYDKGEMRQHLGCKVVEERLASLERQ